MYRTVPGTYVIEISGNRYCRNEVSILVKPVDKLMQIWEKDCLFKRFYCHLKRSYSKAPMQSFLDCPTMQPLNGRSPARVQSTKPKVIFRSERKALIYDRPWIMILRSAKAAAETSWKSPSVNATNSTRSLLRLYPINNSGASSPYSLVFWWSVSTRFGSSDWAT